jgi:hypothetical protein
MYHPYSGGECPTNEVYFASRAAAAKAVHNRSSDPFDEPAERLGGFSERRIEDAQFSVGYENLDSILAYDGLRSCVHRSRTSKTGAGIGRTEEDGFLPRRWEAESALEKAYLTHMLIHPNTFGLKCQPLKVCFRAPIGKHHSNTLDFLVTLKSGESYYVFVRYDDSLSRDETSLIISEIKHLLPEGYGLLVVSEVEYPAQVRSNNERLFIAKRFPDAGADKALRIILKDVLNTDKLTIEELVKRCNFGPRDIDDGRAFQAILRAIADEHLLADRNLLISYPTVIAFPS